VSTTFRILIPGRSVPPTPLNEPIQRLNTALQRTHEKLGRSARGLDTVRLTDFETERPSKAWKRKHRDGGELELGIGGRFGSAIAQIVGSALTVRLFLVVLTRVSQGTLAALFGQEGEQFSTDVTHRSWLSCLMPKAGPDGSGARRFDPATYLATAAKGRTISGHQKGATIFGQGDPTDSVFISEKAKSKVTVVSKQGKEAVVALLSADEFLGEGCLIGQAKRLATATAMTECVTMRLERSEMQRVLRREPAFSQMFVSHILSRNARVEEDLVDQLFNSTEKRLARLLLLLANFGRRAAQSP